MTPVLICFSSEEFTKSGIWYIFVDKTSIELGDIDAEKAFQILFQTYYVFNLEYSKHLIRFFNFIEAFYFGIEGVNPIGIVGKYYNSLK